MDVLAQIDVVTFVIVSGFYLVVLGLPVVTAIKWLVKRVKR